MIDKRLFNDFVSENYFVGVHGITGRKSEGEYLNPMEIAESILNNGLIKMDWGGILGNTVFLGRKHNNTYDELINQLLLSIC